MLLILYSISWPLLSFATKYLANDPHSRKAPYQPLPPSSFPTLVYTYHWYAMVNKSKEVVVAEDRSRIKKIRMENREIYLVLLVNHISSRDILALVTGDLFALCSYCSSAAHILLNFQNSRGRYSHTSVREEAIDQSLEDAFPNCF